MSELAFNVNGEVFEVPPLATGWRVRRVKPKGAPEVVYGRDGAPLLLSIDADFEDLKKEVSGPGRYRLDPVDDRHRMISDAPAAYVFVHPEPPPVLPPLMARHDGERTGVPESALLEAMRMNMELARSVVDRFPAMMESAAVLLRAADGAGLPARPPMALAIPEGDEGEEDGLPQTGGGFDLNALAAQLVSPIVTALASGRLKLPGLAAVADWRKASPSAAPTSEPATSTGTTATPDRSADPAAPSPSAAPASDALPALDPSGMAQFLAIQQALTLEERALAQGLASELSPAELRAWLAALAALPVPAAVAKLREVLHGSATQTQTTEVAS